MKINHVLKCALVSSAILGASHATAQDWSGNWIGFSLGYGSGSYDQGDDDLGQVGPKVDVDGLMLGLRFARNFQRGTSVFGFDADISNGVSGITPQGTTSAFWICGTGDCNINIQTLVTVRGRYGWLVSPETLAYGAGGLAVGKIEGGIFNSVQQGRSTAVGYTVGVGVERMVGQSNTVFGEVSYVDLGKLDFGTGVSAADTYDGVGDFATVKVGWNFRF